MASHNNCVVAHYSFSGQPQEITFVFFNNTRSCPSGSSGFAPSPGHPSGGPCGAWLRQNNITKAALESIDNKFH